MKGRSDAGGAETPVSQAAWCGHRRNGYRIALLLLIVWGIIEFGRAMMAAQIVTVAASESARTGALDGTTNSDVEQLVHEMLTGSLRLYDADIRTTVTVNFAPGNDNPGNNVGRARSGDRVTVRVQVPYEKVNVFPVRWLQDSRLSAHVSMRYY